MKIAIYGAGAIGCYLAAALTRSGCEVTLVARGRSLDAIRSKGVTLVTESERFTAHPFVTDDAGKAGVQDYVFVALKAQDFPSAAASIAKLAGPGTAIVTAMNGIPYWYFHGAESPWRGRTIDAVDPGGVLWKTLPPQNAIGCVLYPWAAMLEPGVVEQSTSNRFILGEPDGTASPRVRALSGIMIRGGLDSPVTATIRNDLWGKLWGNLSMNPLSALTGATVDRLAFEPPLRALARQMMVEAADVAASLGVTLPMTVDERIAIAGSAGARKTSMLQDLEAGKPLEIEALLGAVVELAALTGHDLQFCRTILALTRESARNRTGQ